VGTLKKFILDLTIISLIGMHIAEFVMLYGYRNERLEYYGKD
jgi:choline kinase